MYDCTGKTASVIFSKSKLGQQEESHRKNRVRRLQAYRRLDEILRRDQELRVRMERVTSFARTIRTSEYQISNACNIRCKGCWFFEYAHDKETAEVKDLVALERFLQQETKIRRINSALVIGGEPALFLDRLRIYRKTFKYLTVSTNGLKRIPVEGFEDATIGITIFGGGPLDDELRAIRPGGQRFKGLFEQALRNYEGDDRAGFVYALSTDGVQYIEPTVQQISASGHQVNFNFYNSNEGAGLTDPGKLRELILEAQRVAQSYPETVVSHPYYIAAMLTGETSWGTFGYRSCPSISIDHPAHRDRLRNGRPSLPSFNTWAADLKTVKFCCTSGHCNGCRDSQAVFSWILMNPECFFETAESVQTWVEIAESYWRQFHWSPFHPSKLRKEISHDPA